MSLHGLIHITCACQHAQHMHDMPARTKHAKESESLGSNVCVMITIMGMGYVNNGEVDAAAAAAGYCSILSLRCDVTLLCAYVVMPV